MEKVDESSNTLEVPSFPPAVSIARHPAMSLTNIKNHVGEVLDYSNFLLWRELFLPILKGYNVIDHIDGSSSCPPTTDPLYNQWIQIDSLVLSWIQATISRELLRQIITPGTPMTAYSAWTKIGKIFQDQVSSRIVYLRQEFYHLEKGSLSMSAFLEKLKHLYDSLSSIGDSISYKDVVMQIVMGLGTEYNHITAAISSKNPLPSFDECRTMLLLEETKLQKQQQRSTLAPSTAFVAHCSPLTQQPDTALFMANRGRGGGGRRGGFFHGGGRRGGSFGSFSQGRGFAPPGPRPFSPVRPPPPQSTSILWNQQ